MPKIKNPKFSFPGERAAEICPFCTFEGFVIGLPADWGSVVVNVFLWVP